MTRPASLGLLLGMLGGCYPYLPGSVRPDVTPDPGDDPSVPGLTGGPADSDPGDPSDPTDPVDPTDPTDPTEPTEPEVWSSHCAPGPNQLGPWPAHPLYGVPLRNQPYSADTGLGAVIAATQGQTSFTSVDLFVSGAVVTATEDGYSTFWLQDTSGAMVAWDLDLPFNPATLAPGDQLDLRVTQVQDYFGTLEITEAQVTRTATGVPVYVDDVMTGDVLDYDDAPQELVEVWGEITSQPSPCSADCFDLDHGAAQPVTLRVATGSGLQPGDCVHVIAPLDQFDGQTQLDMVQDRWFRTF